MFSGGCMSWITLVSMQKNQSMSVKILLRNKAACMVISKLLKSWKGSFEVSKLLSNSQWVKKWKSWQMAGIFEKEEILKLSCATACLIGDGYYYHKFFIGKFLLS